MFENNLNLQETRKNLRCFTLLFFFVPMRETSIAALRCKIERNLLQNSLNAKGVVPELFYPSDINCCLLVHFQS